MEERVGGLIGQVFIAGPPIEVTAAMIAAFCAAVGERTQQSPDAVLAADRPSGRLAAPLSIAGGFRAVEDILDRLPPNERRLLASMELEFIAPIYAGDRITVASQIADSYEKTGRSGALTFTVIRSTLTNQEGMLVARIDHRFTTRPGRAT